MSSVFDHRDATIYCHVTHVVKNDYGEIVELANPEAEPCWSVPLNMVREQLTGGFARYFTRETVGSTEKVFEISQTATGVELDPDAPTPLHELPVLTEPCEEDTATLIGAVQQVARLLYALPADLPAVRELQIAYGDVTRATARTAAILRLVTDGVGNSRGHTSDPPKERELGISP
ncbi:MAG: hypothetical protein AAGA68_10175 [Pseudomonadota bacterium]